VEVNEGWFRWDFGDQYVTLTDGTNLKLYEPSDSVVSGITESEGAAQGAYRVVYYNGAWEWIADGIINGFYADGGDYDGTFVPINYGNYGGGWQDILMSRYVHEKDGELFDIPFPGAVCNGNWMLESTVSGLQRWGGTQYGIVPVDKYAIINGIACPIENITKAGESVNGSFVYDGTIYTDVTMGIDIAVVINNSANFNITQIGYQVPYGTNEYDRWQFDTEGTMLVDADDHIFDQYWNYQNLGDYNGLYNSTEDNDGGFYLTNVSSGEKINITRMGILPIYNVSIVDSWEWPNTILEDNLSALRSWWFWDGPYRRLCLANGTWLNYTDDFVNIEVIGEDHTIANCDNYSIVIEDYQTNERYNWTEINPWNWDFNFTWEFEGETYNAREDTHFVNNWGHDEWFRDIQLAWMVEIDGEWKEIKDPNYQWEWSPSGQQYVRANNWYSVYNVTFDGYNNYTIISNSSYIYKKSTVLGHPTGNFLRDQNVMNMRDVNRFVVGTPEYDMWGLRLWWTTDTGALDLDGDMSTTHDQYFVAKNYSNTNNFEHHREYMDVSVEYDPDTAVAYNSMEIRSNIALNTMTWSCDWSEYFNWFYADNFTLLSTPEMEAIQDKVSDTSTRQAKPGYWDIARMAYNRTAEDIKAEAEAMGWWWMEEDEQVWTWMEFNLDQDYWADFYDDDGDIESSLI
ncbi:MAG: hypothetical protein GY855_17665, partial [candidate division Zixibacteria bacterium]|nr:hypothetical protein [candidate division Zixibacteria bacterium]